MVKPNWLCQIFRSDPIYAAFLALLVVGCEKTEGIKESAFLMGTIVEITVQHEDPAAAKKVIEDAFSDGERIEGLMSVYQKESEISMINRKAGSEGVKVSQDTLSVIEHALGYSELSDGAFDITAGPLLELWGFSGGEKKVPEEREVEKMLPLVNWRDLSVESHKSTVKLEKKGMKIDLGGIAKGFVVDRMVAVLKEGGIKRALVNAGGDLYALGSPRGEKAWTVGIRDPVNREVVREVVNVRDRAVATSGGYEKYFISGGRRFSHIIDPRTGYPASGLLSVTVIAKTTMESDALATALFVLGEEQGKKLVRRLDGVEAIFF